MPWVRMTRLRYERGWRLRSKAQAPANRCEVALIEVARPSNGSRAGQAMVARRILRNLKARGWVDGVADIGRVQAFPLDHPGRRGRDGQRIE